MTVGKGFRDELSFAVYDVIGLSLLDLSPRGQKRDRAMDPFFDKNIRILEFQGLPVDECAVFEKKHLNNLYEAKVVDKTFTIMRF